MVLSYVTYGLCILLVLWGLKFPGFGKKFNDDFLDKSSSKAICGLAAIFVVLHHISQKVAFQDVTKELFFFNDIGYLIVTVFFFFSGYGLTVNADNNPKYLDSFASRRLLTVLVPFYVNNIIYAIYNIPSGMHPLRLILGVLGLVQINPNGWYPFVLILFYGLFYFARKRIKSRPAELVFYLMCSLLLVVVFSINGHFAWWADKEGWWIIQGFNNKPWWMQEQVFLFSGEWWVNSTIGFVVGATVASYKDKIVNWFKKAYWPKAIILVALFFVSYFKFVEIRNKYNCWTEYWNLDPGIVNKLVTTYANVFVSFIFIVAFVVLLMKFRSDNPITRFMGKISYETYLIGYITLDVFSFLIFYSNGDPKILNPFHYNMGLYIVAVLASSIALGFAMNKLNCLIVNKIRKK